MAKKVRCTYYRKIIGGPKRLSENLTFNNFMVFMNETRQEVGVGGEASYFCFKIGF